MKWIKEKWDKLVKYVFTTYIDKVHKFWHTVVDNVIAWVDTTMKTATGVLGSFTKTVIAVVMVLFLLDAIFQGRFHIWEFTITVLTQFVTLLKDGGWLLVTALAVLVFVKYSTKK